MFKLDESFLEELGLKDMPEGQKEEFLRHVQEELEVKIGTQMAVGMSDVQMGEFEKIAEGDQGVINGVLAEAGDYRNDGIYKTMIEKGGFADGAPETLQEYASMKWLMKNRPDYAETVRGAVAEIKKEIVANRESILGGTQQPS